MKKNLFHLLFQWSLALCLVSCGSVTPLNAQSAILQGTIDVEALKPVSQEERHKIQPGTPLKLSVEIENIGEGKSSASEIFVSYAFAHPLENQKGSRLYTSEKKELPSIEPKEKIKISFITPHITPTLTDFIKYDWPLREYQLILVQEGKEKIIGTLPLTFSAYYYGGIKKEYPHHQTD